MKRSSIITLGAIALIGTVPFFGNTPVLAGFFDAGEAIAQSIRRPKVNLNLAAAKRLIQFDKKGKQQVIWQDLGSRASVNPGDVLRYTVTGENVGSAPAKNLAVTQPIPDRTVYKIGSAKSNNEAQITYSIDNGKSFVENPKVRVTLPDGTVTLEPAPADRYTHVRWTFANNINPDAGLQATYDVTIP